MICDERWRFETGPIHIAIGIIQLTGGDMAAAIPIITAGSVVARCWAMSVINRLHSFNCSVGKAIIEISLICLLQLFQARL